MGILQCAACVCESLAVETPRSSDKVGESGGKTALRLRLVISGGLIDLVRSHLACDVAHLLANVVAAAPTGKRVQLRFYVGGRLAAQPGLPVLLSISPWQEPQGGILRMGAPVTTIDGAASPASSLFDGTCGK